MNTVPAVVRQWMIYDRSRRCGKGVPHPGPQSAFWQQENGSVVYFLGGLMLDLRIK